MKNRIIFFALIICLLFAVGWNTGRWVGDALIKNLTVTGNAVISGTVSGGKAVNAYATAEGSGTKTMTEAECRGQILTNQGASDEVDIVAYASDQGDMFLVRQEEAQVMEVCPETGGYIVLDGTALDQNDCIDSDGSTIGSWAVFTRGKNAAGTAVWFADTDGLWADTGATD